MPELQGTNVLYRTWDAAPSLDIGRGDVFRDMLDWAGQRL
jgi:hypothetical protein